MFPIRQSLTEVINQCFNRAGTAQALPSEADKGGQDEGAFGGPTDDGDNHSGEAGPAPARRLQPSCPCRRPEPDQQLGADISPVSLGVGRDEFAIPDKPDRLWDADVPVTVSIMCIVCYTFCSVPKDAINYPIQSKMEIESAQTCPMLYVEN